MFKHPDRLSAKATIAGSSWLPTNESESARQESRGQIFRGIPRKRARACPDSELPAYKNRNSPPRDSPVARIPIYRIHNNVWNSEFAKRERISGKFIQ